MNNKKIFLFLFFIIFIYRPIYFIVNWKKEKDIIRNEFSSNLLINFIMVCNILITLIPAIIIYYRLIVGGADIKLIIYSQVSFVILLIFAFLKIITPLIYDFDNGDITLYDKILEFTYNLTFLSGLLYIYLDFENIDGSITPIIGKVDHLINFSLI